MLIGSHYPQKIRIISLLLAFVVCLVLFAASYLPTFSSIENRVYDRFHRSLDNSEASSDVVIVFIGDDTINALGSWPLSRDYYTTLIYILKEWGARTIVFDLLFSEPDPNPEFNEDFINTISNSGNVYLPYYLLMSPTTVTPFPIPLVGNQANTEISDSVETADADFPLAFDGIFPFEELRNTCRGMGHSNIEVDHDGIVRRHPLMINYNDALYPSLGLVAVTEFLGISNTEIEVVPGKTIKLSAENTIPIDKKGTVLLKFLSSLDRFQNFSMLQILQSYIQLTDGETPLIAPANFQDKIVLIGVTATGASDLNSTPTALYPEVGIQATVIDNILRQTYFLYAPAYVIVIELMLIALLLALSLTHLRLNVSLAFNFGFSLVIIVLHYFILKSLSVYLDTFLPISAIVLGFLAISFYLFRKEREKREQLTSRLNHLQDLVNRRDKRIYQIEAALAKKSEEMEEIQHRLETETKRSLSAEIDRLMHERDELLNERQNLIADKAAISERIDIIKGETRAYIFEQHQPSPLRQKLKGNYDFIIGESESLMKELQKVDRAAPFDSNILITGESGTGKELIARAIHENSLRQNGPYVVVNCAAIPSELIESELFGHEKGSFTSAAARHIGKFEFANNGTLFLDEIGDMPLSMQAKILRAIQQKEIRRVGGNQNIKVDVRIIAATNKDLPEEVAEKRFRDDLFHRLNVIPIRVPPLRDRKEDIPDLVEFFIQRKNEKYPEVEITVTQGVMNGFINYSWPGNIRELEQNLERMIILSEDKQLTFSDLPKYIQQAASSQDEEKWQWGFEMPLKDVIEEYEKKYILKKLQQYNWNISKTSEMLQIGRRNLHKKLTKYGISREEEDDDSDD